MVLYGEVGTLAFRIEEAFLFAVDTVKYIYLSGYRITKLICLLTGVEYG